MIETTATHDHKMVLAMRDGCQDFYIRRGERGETVFRGNITAEKKIASKTQKS
jgi:hypothetical protein